jgi:ParB family chromosome partitioning protein
VKNGHGGIALVPIDRVNVVNPRSRNQRSFDAIVENIAAVGLKRPITVARRGADEDGPCYDLVCGQGRLEAYAALKQTAIPAFVIDADHDDCLVASLVENCARRHHNAVDLLQDVGRLQEAGSSPAEIARKTGLSADYVGQVAKLLSQGERRLLVAVEAGFMPISVATEIAEAEDEEVQHALASAYEKGLLKGRKLIAARRIVESRRRCGKSLAPVPRDAPRRLSAEALV